MIGHRGANQLALENSIEAIALAGEIGAKWVEFDIRMSTTGIPVVAHDPGQEGDPLAAILIVAEQYQLNIIAEIKTLNVTLLALELLEVYPFEVVVSSFDLEVLKLAYPRFRVGYLLTEVVPIPNWIDEVHIPIELVGKILTDKPISVYTVNDRALASVLWSEGMSIFTDNHDFYAKKTDKSTWFPK